MFRAQSSESRVSDVVADMRDVFWDDEAGLECCGRCGFASCDCGEQHWPRARALRADRDDLKTVVARE